MLLFIFCKLKLALILLVNKYLYIRFTYTDNKYDFLFFQL